VRNRLFVFLRGLLCALLLWAPATYAQDQLSVWRVEVRGQDVGTPSGDYVADLLNLQHQKVATTNLRADGYFEFRNIAYGDYWLIVTEGDKTIYAGMVTAHPGGWEETLDLSAIRRARAAAAPPTGPVSVAELRHPPSRKAFNAFIAAQQLAQSGRFAEATTQLEKAVHLSPDWPEAHTNLAADYLRLGRFENSIAESRRAIELNKPNAIDLGNIAFAEYSLNRRPEAIAAAREGLSADPSSPKLHYMLGSLLALDRKTLSESIPHLELAAKTIPGARQNLAAARQAMR
jgi:tetratricopeptide (TPR) repeat protein